MQKAFVLRSLIVWVVLGCSGVCYANGYFSGVIHVDDQRRCRIDFGTDSDRLTCSIGLDSQFGLPAVTIDFESFGLRKPPICTFTGVPPKNSIGGQASIGTQPVLTAYSPRKVTAVLNGIPVFPCACGNVAVFNCSISD